MNSARPLPRNVQDVADVIGRDAALTLVDSLPRAMNRPWQSWLYVPQRIRADHALVLLMGWDVACKLVRAFGGEMLTLSNCSYSRKDQRDDAIRSMRASGASVQDVAREFRISDRQVRNIVKEISQVESNDNTVNTAAA